MNLPSRISKPEVSSIFFDRLMSLVSFCEYNSSMTSLTVNEVYAIGLPIILSMILLEVFISNLRNKAWYKKGDTLCTTGLLTGNILMSFSVKGLILAFHFYLYQFRIIDLESIVPLWVMWLLTFVLIDLNHVNATLNSQGAVRIDGIIGADFLKSNKAIIDYSLRKLFL